MNTISNSLIKSIAISSLLLTSLQLNAQTDNQNSNSSDSPYTTEIVSGMSLDKRALLGGVVVSSTQVNIAAQVSGDVLSVEGREGDMFMKDSKLITLEQNSIKAQRDSAYAEIASANEALRNAGVQYSRSIVSPNSSPMFGGMSSMFSMFTDPMLQMSGQANPEFDKYANRTSRFTEYQQAGNRLNQAKFKLKEAEERLKDANISAPFDGVIIEKHVSTGDVVQPGQVLMRFANIKNLQVEVNIPSRLIRSLKLKQKYRIKLDIANTVVNAKLAQVYPIADNMKHSVKVKFDLPSGLPVLPGAYAEVELFEANSGNLTPVIPEKAIMWRTSLPSVFVINPQTNKTELRFVRLGEQIGGNRKSVLSGLKIGEGIVTNPNILMISGMKI
jgi:multidrug efflux pump subunit AcrA (membrane-fusion protein)